MTDLSKDAQLSRSPGGNRWCEETGQRILKRSCPGPKCTGARNQRKGKVSQRSLRNIISLKPERWSSKAHNEETWHASSLRWEIKSGKQVEAIAVAYVEARNQSDAHRAHGDVRPFGMGVVPNGSAPLLIFRADEIGEVVSALIEEWTE